VGVAAAADVVGEAITDDTAEDAEVAVPLVLVRLHADPIKAKPAIAMENAAVPLVISRISFLSNRQDDHRPPIRMLLLFATAQQGMKFPGS
jgi:hypothetical protein